jgi:hypothetical protein
VNLGGLRAAIGLITQSTGRCTMQQFVINSPLLGNQLVTGTAAVAVNTAIALSIQDNMGRDVFTSTGKFVASVSASGKVISHGLRYPMPNK